MRFAVADSRRWTQCGTDMLSACVADLSESQLDEPISLPGWTRRHILSHVAANADALCNLIRWAATGERTPMYASKQDRAAGIARGITLPTSQLKRWLATSATDFEKGLDALDAVAWQQNVETAQGRTVPATEIPWLRAREVCVHAVDLEDGTRFADLPTDFLDALIDEIAAKRDIGSDELVRGPRAEIAAWLAGRAHTLEAAELGPWL